MYSIELRMKNPGPAKYLIAVTQRDDLTQAFAAADELMDENDKDHFVQICDESGEVVSYIGLVGNS